MWLDHILKKRYRPQDVQRKLHQLDQWIEKTMPDTGCWNIDWLGELVRKIDDLWYEGQLLKHLEDSYGGLRLELDVESKSVAGYVVETADRKRISLHMNRDLFVELFQKRDVAYHSGGNICRTRASCFLGVLLHETMHLLVTLADKHGVQKEKSEHDQQFKAMIRNWFGQQETLHGLIPGYHAKQDIATIRKALKPGLSVEVFHDGTWHPAVVTQKGRVWHSIRLRNGSRMEVHTGLIRLKD